VLVAEWLAGSECHTLYRCSACNCCTVTQGVSPFPCLAMAVVHSTRNSGLRTFKCRCYMLRMYHHFISRWAQVGSLNLHT
jgi:hypothetical protein